MTTEAIQSVDIPFKVREETARRISDCTVGFVKLTRSDHPDAVLGGSGTLVKVDECHAVLTASHVVEELLKWKQFGLVLSETPRGRLHNLTFERRLVKDVRLPRPEGLDIREPPDIALLILPQGQVGDIAARKSFYNISSRRHDILSSPPKHHLGFWAMCGFADEWTADQFPRYGFERVVGINGKILWGFPTPLETTSEFDGWTFTVERDDDYDGPESFEGYSGGGLWQNLFEKTKTVKFV